MSYFIFRYVAGCVLSCNDADACNSAQRMYKFSNSHIYCTLFVLTIISFSF